MDEQTTQQAVQTMDQATQSQNQTVQTQEVQSPPPQTEAQNTALLDALYAMSQDLNSKFEEQKNYTTSQIQNALKSNEVREQEAQLSALREALGLSQIDDFKKQLEAQNSAMQHIQEQAAIAQAKAGFEALSHKYPNFSKEGIANQLNEIAKNNLALAQSLDNPQGWELIYLAHMANAPKADAHITQNNQGTNSPDLNALKNGQLSLEEIGKLF